MVSFSISAYALQELSGIFFREQNIKGSAETPFLLSRVNELTGGASLASNIALVKNNATTGSKIAVCLAQLRGYNYQVKS